MTFFSASRSASINASYSLAKLPRVVQGCSAVWALNWTLYISSPRLEGSNIPAPALRRDLPPRGQRREPRPRPRGVLGVPPTPPARQASSWINVNAPGIGQKTYRWSVFFRRGRGAVTPRAILEWAGARQHRPNGGQEPMPRTACLSEAELSAYCLGELPEPTLDDVSAHL